MMNKLRKTLPFLIAVLLVLTCYFGIELSQVLLPDYKNSVSEVAKARELSFMYFDNATSPELYPLSSYSSDKTEKVNSKTRVNYINDWLYGLTDAFSDKVNTVISQYNIDFNSSLRYDPERKIYYLKDYKVNVTDNETYIINLAFTKSEILCFSCVQKSGEKLSSKALEEAYRKLSRDYRTFSETEFEGNLVEKSNGEYEEDVTDIKKTDFNVFDDFFGSYKNFDTMCKEKGLKVNTRINDIFDLISNSSAVSVSYNEMIYMTIVGDSSQLIMIYDPSNQRFAGFSYADNKDK